MTGAGQPLPAGTLLQGTYEVVSRVGVGGMGEVYAARHLRLPGGFAIKLLAAQTRAGDPVYARFQREAEIASSLRHPHIVQIVDFNQLSDGRPYIVMELLEGRDLAAELAAAGRLPLGRTRTIVSQVASAVGAAHARGIVHRDLKPSNVFLQALGPGQDFVKVLDFGISKAWAATSLSGDRLVGTPHYMAPEQAEGRGDEVDGRADQFALAAMTYEMLTGRRPFDGDSVPAILYAVAHTRPTPLCALASDVPPTVEAVIARGLARAKEDRFVSITELAEALGAAADGIAPVRVPAVTIPMQPARGGRMAVPVVASAASPRSLSRRWVWGLAGAGGALALAWRWTSRPATAPEVAAPATSPPRIAAGHTQRPPPAAPSAPTPAPSAPAPPSPAPAASTRRRDQPRRPPLTQPNPTTEAAPVTSPPEPDKTPIASPAVAPPPPAAGRPTRPRRPGAFIDEL